MESAIAELADSIVHKYHQTPSPRRVLVAIAGVPGSGKSCLAYPLADRINLQLGRAVDRPAQVDAVEGVAWAGEEDPEGEVAICVGMDGWHHFRAELDAFPDPAEAHRRRGAPFTFNAESYVDFVLSLRASPPPVAIAFPTFSHALKDPLPSPFPIRPHHRIVIIEGLYSLLDVDPWCRSVDVLDERVWVECTRDVARARLVRRHLKEGVETTEENARKRVDRSDMDNGEYIREHLTKPTFVVHSVDDIRIANGVVAGVTK